MQLPIIGSDADVTFQIDIRGISSHNQWWLYCCSRVKHPANVVANNFGDRGADPGSM